MKSLDLFQQQQIDDDNEISSPVLFKSELVSDKPLPPPQRQKEDLYKLYEQLTGPFQELTFSDFVQTQQKHQPSREDVQKSSQKGTASVEIQTPPKKSLQQEIGRSLSPLTAPYSPWSPRSPRPKDGTSRVSPASPVSSRCSPKEDTDLDEHSNHCYTCNTKLLWLKTRCLVCGKLYCRSCVNEAMGSMLEGRKCRDCRGKRFSHRYISRAGKGWWLPSRVREVELRWAKKRPNHHSSIQNSLQSSLQSPNHRLSTG